MRPLSTWRTMEGSMRSLRPSSVAVRPRARRISLRRFTSDHLQEHFASKGVTCYAGHVKKGHHKKSHSLAGSQDPSTSVSVVDVWTPKERNLFNRIQRRSVREARRNRKGAGSFWEDLQTLGMDGQVARMLAGRGLIPHMLHRDLEGWRNVERLITRSLPLFRAWEIQEECLLFELFGFRPMWCEHSRHWYVSDDTRRKDCPRHRWAGQKARYRKAPSRTLSQITKHAPGLPKSKVR